MAPKQLGSKQHSVVEKTLAGIGGNNRLSRTPKILPANLPGHVSAQLAAAEISCSAAFVDVLDVAFKLQQLTPSCRAALPYGQVHSHTSKPMGTMGEQPSTENASI